MKKTILLVLAICMTAPLLAQDSTLVSGRVFDQQTAQPLPFVSIAVMTAAEHKTISGTITGEDGRFSLSGIPRGEYRVEISFVGYRPDSLPLLIGEKNNIFDLGKIELEPQTEELSGVTVTARQAIVSSGLDKKSFSMSDNFAQGGSVLDAMKMLPGVTVDQEGKLLLRGSDKVAVLIDGKQSSLTGFGNQKGLANIPTANIERIEVINNPSAAYDASGMAGIINIVYKKESETGLNGEVAFSAGLGQLSQRRDDLPSELGSYTLNPKYVPSFHLNYRTPSFNIFAQSEVMVQRALPNNEFSSRSYADGTRTLSQVPENRKQTQFIGKAGADWLIDQNNTLTLSSIFDYEDHTDTAQVPYLDGITGLRNRYWNWSESEQTGYANFRMDYKHLFKEPGHELSASLQYTRGWEDETYFLRDSSDFRRSQDTTHIVATEHTIPFSVDYVKPLRSGRLEAGTKLQFRRIPITYTIGRGSQSVIYPGLGDWSKWRENIFAGYLNYVYERKTFDLEAGLRLEQTNVSYDLAPENSYYSRNDSYDYLRLYPNIRLTFHINENNTVSAFYNRRVDRPGEEELRVFPKYDDPELLKVGNPYLRPQFTQTFELAWRRAWNAGSVYLSGYHRRIQDPFTRVYSIDSTSSQYDILNKIYQNVGSSTNTGAELLLTHSITDFWKINGSLNWYVNVIDAYRGTLLFPTERSFYIERTEDNTWDAKLSNEFLLPGELRIQLTGLYYAPKNIPQGRQLARSSVDIGVKKEVLKNRGTINFSFTDIFNQYGLRQEVAESGFDVLYENYYETQVARLGFTYKL